MAPFTNASPMAESHNCCNCQNVPMRPDGGFHFANVAIGQATAMMITNQCHVSLLGLLQAKASIRSPIIPRSLSDDSTYLFVSNSIVPHIRLHSWLSCYIGAGFIAGADWVLPNYLQQCQYLLCKSSSFISQIPSLSYISIPSHSSSVMSISQQESFQRRCWLADPSGQESLK